MKAKIAVANDVETHPLSPFVLPHAKLLMLGSFPPPRHRWTMDFYYPNFQNDMWRILGLVFFQDAHYFVDSVKKSFHEAKIRYFLNEQGIAIADVAYQVMRLQNNAADKFLHIIETIDLNELLMEMPQCRVVVTTGDKATEALLSLLPDALVDKPKIGHFVPIQWQNRCLHLWRLPSSSRAYPLSLQKKANIYQKLFEYEHFLLASLAWCLMIAIGQHH